MNARCCEELPCQSARISLEFCSDCCAFPIFLQTPLGSNILRMCKEIVHRESACYLSVLQNNWEQVVVGETVLQCALNDTMQCCEEFHTIWKDFFQLSLQQWPGLLLALVFYWHCLHIYSWELNSNIAGRRQRDRERRQKPRWHL